MCVPLEAILPNKSIMEVYTRDIRQVQGIPLLLCLLFQMARQWSYKLSRDNIVEWGSCPQCEYIQQLSFVHQRPGSPRALTPSNNSPLSLSPIIHDKSQTHNASHNNMGLQRNIKLFIQPILTKQKSINQQKPNIEKNSNNKLYILLLYYFHKC